MTFTVRNHYVPQWYQRRFFVSRKEQSHLFYLDLKPDLIHLPNGGTKARRALYRLGPARCFQQDHLYTLYFGEHASDVMERRFFGALDAAGEKAVQFFSNYGLREGAHEAFQVMRDYLAAQLFRTPKGLDMLRFLAKTRDHQHTLMVMGEAWQLYHTIWSEGVWEIVNCRNSRTKFLISDSPVSTYNRRVFPGSDEARNYGGALIERVGTHTVFPLDLEHCLVVTNLQYVRNPKLNPLKVRENARYFGQALFDLRKIQRGREIEEVEVLAINYLLKTQARRYIAAADESWLYPELALKNRFWSRLGGRSFLHPDPRLVGFTTGIIVGFDDGSSWGSNEYGHLSLDNVLARRLREVEWATFQEAKRVWDERDRRTGRPRPVLTAHDI